MKAGDLDSSARRELRALGRANAENVARHLVVVQRLLDSDPEEAHRHARYAASHAGRIAVVREAAGIAAYLAGHYAEALRDIRAARRLSGIDMHRAIEADCERALGRHHQALKVAKEADPHQLDDLEEAELAMVISGVRHEMGQSDVGLVVIERAIMLFRGDRETLRRLHSVRADRLEELGRVDEAAAVRRRIGEDPQQEPGDEIGTVEVYDIEDDFDQEQARAEETEGGDPAPTEGDELTEPVPAGDPEHGEDGRPADDDRDEDDEDGQEPASFAERVEAEMTELLGETPTRNTRDAEEGSSKTDGADPDADRDDAEHHDEEG